MNKLFVRTYGKVPSWSPLWTSVPETVHFVNATSNSRNSWEQQLSPMVLGPCKTYGGMQALTVEAAWQFSKVVSHFWDQSRNCHIPTGHLGEDDNPTEDWFEWRDINWSDPRLTVHNKFFFEHKAYLRRPFGKKSIVAYNWWDGMKYNYIDSRSAVYVPLYEEAVMKTDAFKRLCDLALSGSLRIFDYDSYDNVALGMSLDDCLSYENHPYGHGFVLAGLLSKTLGMPLAVLEDYN